MTDENTSPLVGSWGPGKNSGGQCWGSLWKRLTVMVGPLEARPKTRSGTCYTRWATRLRPWRLLPWRTFLLSAHQRVWDFFFTPSQGNPSRSWRSCPFWNRPRAVNDWGWRNLHPLGWSGSPNAPRKPNYHPWCHHSDQATLIPVGWGNWRENKINKHFALARWHSLCKVTGCRVSLGAHLVLVPKITDTISLLLCLKHCC